ncbi:hypothetical protein C7W88_15425 [Novosphingobium sp. THN1]|jgi:hypothetical protein|uniref:hypothetical protein n=1 Tax=Novosphingobium sp. THN1 TaxID=1016987 RepID=UPI000E49C13C|nr:hypothetical protein [Novosphingobium sp. THN1]AXU20123.1 hypothetical protein C7W88_15425 [Novosphingobium sp. THN1]
MILRMRSPLDLLTPGQISRTARVVAVASAVALSFGYVTNELSVTTAGVGSFFLACSLLLAAPRQRATELLGAVTVWQCFAEFLSTVQSGQFAIWRLGVSIATLGCVMAVIRVQHLRELTRQSPDMQLQHLDRRTVNGMGILPRTDAQLAELRHEEAA